MAMQLLWVGPLRHRGAVCVWVVIKQMHVYRQFMVRSMVKIIVMVLDSLVSEPAYDNSDQEKMGENY